MQQLRCNYHITVSHDFINDYLNGGGYQINEDRNQGVIMNKKRKLRKYG